MAATDEVREKLAEKIIEQALAGCLQSQRLIVERFMPAVRAQTLAQPLPGIEAGSIEQRLEKVLAHAAQGSISADEAAVFVSAIKGATEAAAIANLERDLEQVRALRKTGLEALGSPQKALEVERVAGPD